MGRVLGIDYGQKRTGIASTDPLKIIASPLTTVPTKAVIDFLKDYCSKENVEVIVVGLPKDLQNRDTHATSLVLKFIDILKKLFPNMDIVSLDERFTSKIARDSLLEGGMKKQERRKKGNLDKVSAAIILQSWLDRQTS